MNDNPLNPVATRDAAAMWLRQRGYVLLRSGDLAPVLSVDARQLLPLQGYWEALPRDDYLRDGGHYRARRHSCFIENLPASLAVTPQRAHWQPTSYNALHGGLQRWYQPIAAAVLEAPAFRQLLLALGSLFAQVRATSTWYIEAHQFRIDTEGGIGRPTPEGAHRDGVDFVALALVQRSHVRGGETRVFDANGVSGIRFTMQEPWSLLLLDDSRVIHETTPIQPETTAPASQPPARGLRDTLVLTFRAGGFQAPD
jgi:hypothetical protein